MKVVIALGSNLGDRTSYIDQAVAQLSQVITVLKVSSKIETEPVSEIAQPNYLNAVLVGETKLEPNMILKMAQWQLLEKLEMCLELNNVNLSLNVSCTFPSTVVL